MAYKMQSLASVSTWTKSETTTTTQPKKAQEEDVFVLLHNSLRPEFVTLGQLDDSIG
jgi:hypothetical protein